MWCDGNRTLLTEALKKGDIFLSLIGLFWGFNNTILKIFSIILTTDIRGNIIDNKREF